ncbi:MAG: phospholipase D family protein [Azoarcus sp.]|jgi:phosphatidylserine/phosphatidylglycerophosphate/cardiolipin synthase-like enzyme|nr:phospholipase D family protein [Azoarcus sp.]
MRKILFALTLALLSAASQAAETFPADAAYDVGFSPNRGALEIILKGIESAKESILVAAYSFTSKPISTALLAAQRRGVDVRVVADGKANSGNNYTAVTFLANQGVPVRLNGRHTINHSKFMVIDGRHVETGSFNYTSAAAKKNAENVLILWNVKPLADQYTAEWKRLWDGATPVEKAY